MVILHFSLLVTGHHPGFTDYSLQFAATMVKHIQIRMNTQSKLMDPIPSSPLIEVPARHPSSTVEIRKAEARLGV